MFSFGAIVQDSTVPVSFSLGTKIDINVTPVPENRLLVYIQICTMRLHKFKNRNRGLTKLQTLVMTFLPNNRSTLKQTLINR